MNRVIITGAAGFIGSAVVKECLEKGLVVFAIDVVDNPSKRLPLSNKNLIYIKKDLSEHESLVPILIDKNIDSFFHFAWMGSSGPLREDYSCQIENAVLTVELMKFAKRIGCSKFIVAGSIMEFEANEAIYAQETKPQLSYLYGVGKSLAHKLCKPISNQIGIELMWGYITNAFGVNEQSNRLIISTIRKCIKHEKLDFSSGTQNYDFVYIDDVARAFYLIGEKGKPNKSYLIGSGQAKPLKYFLNTLVKICDKNATPVFGSVPFTGVNQSLETFSIKELEMDCSYKPRISFEEGIAKTFEWLKGEMK